MKHLLKPLLLLLLSQYVYAGVPATVEVSTDYDSTKSTILSTKVYSLFGESQVNAFAIEMAVGKNTARLNTTYALQPSSNHLIKITHDLLFQTKEFDFGGGFGTHKEEVSQNAIGGAYYYNVDNKYINGVELSSYFSYAPSITDSGKKVATYLPLGEGVYDEITFHGRLAGSKLNHHEINTELSPWANSVLIVGVDLEKLTFDNKVYNSNSSTNFGWHVKYDQVLSPWVKASTSYRGVQTFQSIGGDVSVLLPSPDSIQFEVTGSFLVNNNTTLDKKYMFGGLKFKTEFGVSEQAKPTYTTAASSKKSLHSWVSDPVVRLQDVLVTPEVSYTKGLDYTYLTAPPNNIIHRLTDDVQQGYYKGALWKLLRASGTPTAATINFKHIILNKAQGTVTARYINGLNYIDIIYLGSKKVVGGVGANWKDYTNSGVVFSCTEDDVADCVFEVER